MSLNTQVIGKTMGNGFAGYYAQQPDQIVSTHAAGGKDNIVFGSPLKYDASGNVVLMGAGSTTDQFVGIAAAEVKTALNYLKQGVGEYASADAVSVFQRGVINVKCQKGAPKRNGKVYIRITANPAHSTAAVGGFEAADDTDKTIELTNCRWASEADSSGVAALRILFMINA